MAGIISNVDSDVQKLRKLKNEIENVKKALMGINIKVDIDIAKGLQSQLTSLLGQYDTLVDKIAAAERKIMLSTSRINKATEKIVQAQEQVSKPVVIPTQSGNTSTQTNTAETASIQAQAKAYDDLRTEINGILGTREENVKRMIDEMNAIRLINVEIKKINKSQGDYSSLSSTQQKRLEQLNNSLLTHKTALSEVRQALNNNAKLDNVAATSMNGLSQSLSRMRIAYRELTEEERNSPFGKELLASIQQADTKIKELDATIGNHQRNVGDYVKQWNGLQYQMQMVARELPNFAINPQIGIMSLTNNIPYLVDELNKAKKAYKEYVAAVKVGQTDLKVVPSVGKQIVSSLLNWQTAIVMGITLITAYRKEISDWIVGLFKAKDVMKPFVDIQQQLNEVQLKGAQNAQSEITKLELLYKATQNVSKPISERKKAIDELQKSYPDFFKNLSDEEILTGKAADAYTRLTSSIIASARARAAQDKMKENAKKILENEDKITAEYAKRKEAQLELDKQIELRNKIDREANPDMYAGRQMMVGAALGKVEEIDEGIAKLRREIYELNKSQNELAQNIDVNDLIFNPNEDSSKIGEKERKRRQEEAEKLLKQQEQLAEQLLSLRRKNQQDEINLRADGMEKKLAQIDLDYQKELDAIESAREKAKKDGTYEQQSPLLDEAEENVFKRYQQAVTETHKQEAEAQNEAMNRYLKEYGTFQQKKDAITKEYNDKMAKVTTEGEKKLLQKEMEEALSSVDMDKLKQEINWELIFGDLNKVSKKSLEQVKQQLKTFKNSDEYKNMAVDQKKVIDEALNNIQSTIIDKGGLLGDLPEQLDALRIAQDELKQAQDEYNKSLKSGTDAEKEAALKKKNKAEKNVQNAETNVTRSADKTQKSLITLTDTVTQLGSSSEMSLSQIGNLAAGLVDTFSEAGSKIGGIVGTVFSLLDGIEKQGFDGFVKNVFSSVFGAGASMWNTLTFGGFNKLFGIGGNAKEVQDSINRLTDRNETLQTSIESLTDEIKASKGTKSVAAYRSAYEYQKEQNSNYLNIAREQAGYHNSHKSWQYYMRWSAEDLKWIQQNINKNFTGTSSLWELTPEEMEKLRSNVDIWTKMQNAGKGGYGERVTDKLDDYIEQAGKLEELTDNLYEGLTGMSFDSMYDSFVSSLMDMEKSAEDVADDISKYFMQAMLSNAIGEQFSDKLRTWYDKFGEAMKDDGTLDNNERKELMDEYMGYVDEAMKLRDELAAATGYDKISQESTSQSASSKGFQAMSQDTGEELNGRFTALQIAGEEIKNQNIIQSQSLNLLTVKADALLSINTETRNIADNTRDLIAQSYLELVQISENTGAIVKPIIQIQKDMAEVKNNTSKL